jgi:tetratricopeptide (TPR) repeat protein
MSLKSKLLLICTLLSLPIFADQNDEALDIHFQTLQQSTDREEIQRAERRIWMKWMDHDDYAVARLMTIAAERMNYQRYPEAMLVYNQLIQNYPDYAEAWNKRATLNYLLGNLDESIADVEKTLQLEPRHFGALSGLGLIYIQRKEFAKAKQAFEDLIEVHPSSPNAQQNLQLVNEEIRLGVI